MTWRRNFIRRLKVCGADGRSMWGDEIRALDFTSSLADKSVSRKCEGWRLIRVVCRGAGKIVTGNRRFTFYSFKWASNDATNELRQIPTRVSSYKLLEGMRSGFSDSSYPALLYCYCVAQDYGSYWPLRSFLCWWRGNSLNTISDHQRQRTN